MPITRLILKRFTAFEKLDLKFSPGINVLIGENGTGKTHIMKAAYAACDVSNTKKNFAEKLVLVFLPSHQNIGRLVKRRKGGGTGSVEVHRDELRLRASFTNQAKRFEKAEIIGAPAWSDDRITCVFIPAKEILSNAPGFLAENAEGRLNFEEVYTDIVLRALKLPPKGPMSSDRKLLMDEIQKIIQGWVYVNHDRHEFFLRNKQGDLEFTLLAEGLRKLGLIWRLIQNDTLLGGAVLFWDEPEANLNPKMYGPVIEILLKLQLMGVQIFLSTHDYVILKEFDLRKNDQNAVIFHALYHKEGATGDGDIECNSTDEFLQIHPNVIQDTFLNLYDRDVLRDLKS